MDKWNETKELDKKNERRPMNSGPVFGINKTNMYVFDNKWKLKIKMLFRIVLLRK